MAGALRRDALPARITFPTVLLFDLALKIALSLGSRLLLIPARSLKLVGNSLVSRLGTLQGVLNDLRSLVFSQPPRSGGMSADF